MIVKHHSVLCFLLTEGAILVAIKFIRFLPEKTNVANPPWLKEPCR